MFDILSFSIGLAAGFIVSVIILATYLVLFPGVRRLASVLKRIFEMISNYISKIINVLDALKRVVPQQYVKFIDFAINVLKILKAIIEKAKQICELIETGALNVKEAIKRFEALIREGETAYKTIQEGPPPLPATVYGDLLVDDQPYKASKDEFKIEVFENKENVQGVDIYTEAGVYAITFTLKEPLAIGVKLYFRDYMFYNGHLGPGDLKRVDIHYRTTETKPCWM